jgi:hypothetical protein
MVDLVPDAFSLLRGHDIGAAVPYQGGSRWQGKVEPRRLTRWSYGTSARRESTGPDSYGAPACLLVHGLTPMWV